MRGLDLVLGTVEPEPSKYGYETPATIVHWSMATFGPRDALSVAIRTSREVNELLISILYGESLESIHEELADSAIMLWQVAELLNINARPDFVVLPSRIEYSPQRVILLLQKRMTSVLEELFLGTPDARQVAETVLSDALRLLEALAVHYKVSLPAVVDTKMGVNRERLWVKEASGSYQHSGKEGHHGLAHPAE